MDILNFTLYPPESKVAFYIFDFSVKWYGIILASAISIGIFLSYLFLCKKYSKKEANDMLDFCPYLVFSAIIGARLFYILGNLDFYIKHPSEIIMINHGGLSIFGAIIFGAIYFIVLSKIKKIDFLKYIDCITLSLPICQTIGRLGNYFNQEAFGKPYEGFLKLYVSPLYRPEQYNDFKYFHPTFLYEGMLNLINFLILLFIFLKFKNIKKGTITFLYLIFYSITRIVVENIRIDSILNIHNMPIAIFLSIIIIMISVFGLYYINKKQKIN